MLSYPGQNRFDDICLRGNSIVLNKQNKCVFVCNVCNISFCGFAYFGVRIDMILTYNFGRNSALGSTTGSLTWLDSWFQTGQGLIWKDQKRKTKLIWSIASESSSPKFYMMVGGWTDNKRELCFLLILYNWSQENRQYWRAEPQQIISHQINLHNISFLIFEKKFLGKAEVGGDTSQYRGWFLWSERALVKYWPAVILSKADLLLQRKRKFFEFSNIL